MTKKSDTVDKYYITGTCSFCRHLIIDKGRFDEKARCALYLHDNMEPKSLTFARSNMTPGVYIHPLDECRYVDLFTSMGKKWRMQWWNDPAFTRSLDHV
jgi:hypothetical protein